MSKGYFIGKKTAYFLCMLCLIIMVLTISCNRKKDEYIDVFTASWEEIIKQADGETLYFNAWGGSNQINQYIQWVKKVLKSRYNINLIHVLLQDSLEATRRIQQEKVANNIDNGSVGLFWLNGNAFHILKEQRLFLGNIFDIIPNKKYVRNSPVLFEDFTEPTEGFEVPWGTAQLIFFYKQDKVLPFNSLNNLPAILAQYPGTFTYPNPTLDFTGRTFLKNLIYHFASDSSVFYSSYTDSEQSQDHIANNGVWDFLDTIHPLLWSKGKRFPNTYSDMVTYFKDSELHYGMSFNPYYPLSQVLKEEFPSTIRTFLIEEGTVANAHFLTIPFNASAKAAGLVAINFLISPEAQARKADPVYWGDPSILNLDALEVGERELFESIATLQHASKPPEGLGVYTVKEFHSTWEAPIQEYWKVRYQK